MKTYLRYSGTQSNSPAIYLSEKLYEQNKTSVLLPSETSSTPAVEQWFFWGPAHLATASLLILIFFISIFLALQFALKYRKYHIAEDLDTLSEHSGKCAGHVKRMLDDNVLTLRMGKRA